MMLLWSNSFMFTRGMGDDERAMDRGIAPDRTEGGPVEGLLVPLAAG
jgi:hypothetical protein